MPSLKSNKNKKRLPSNIAPVTGRCVPLYLPDDPEYVGLLMGAIYDLSLQIRYDRDETHKAKEVATWWRGYWRDLLATIESDANCNPEICEGAACEEFAPDVGWITYAPNDPFQTPGYTPPGYLLSPWYNNPLIPLPGVLPGDAMVNFLSLPLFADLPEIVAAGLPRFRINFQGSGEVEIELVKVPQGGLAYITVDGNPLTGNIVDLNEVSVGTLISLETIFGIVLEGAQIVQTEVVEIDIATSGAHYIDVTFLPNVGTDVIVGFGGGLRRVSLCGLAVPAEVEVAQFQLNGCDLEWRPSSAHAWVVLGDVCGETADLRVTDCGLERLVDETWEAIPDAEFVPIDGSCAMTGGLEINSTEANVPVINATGPFTVPAVLRTVDPNYQAYYETRYNANGNGYRVGMSAGTGPGFFIYNIGSNIYFIRTNGANTAIGPSTNPRLSTEDTTTATLIVRDYRAAGITKQVTRAATAQSSNNLHEYQDSAGAIMASISSAGAATIRNQMLLRGLPATGSAVDLARLYTVFSNSAFSTYIGKVVQTVYSYNGEQTVWQAEANPAAGTPKLAFFGTAPVEKPAVTGQRNNNPALASMLSALSGLGLLTDSTTAGTTGAITSVVVNTLAAGADATADYNTGTGVLTLGIPRGDVGETGAQGEPGECPDCYPSPEPGNTNDELCGTAEYLVDYIDGLFDDILALVDTGASATSVLSTVLTFIIGPVIAEAGGFIQDLLFTNTSGFRAAVSSGVLEDIRCQLYCKLVENGGYSHAALRSWYDDVLADAISGVNLGLQFWIRIVDIIAADQWAQRAYIGSLTPSAVCASLCDCPCDVYDAPAIAITEASAVTSGQTIDITATGTWNHGGGPFGPDGDTATTAGAGFPLEGVAKYCLIARIDTGAWFYVGEGGSFAASATGTLELAMNDDILYDNSGSLSVEICVS